MTIFVSIAFGLLLLLTSAQILESALAESPFEDSSNELDLKHGKKEFSSLKVKRVVMISSKRVNDSSYKSHGAEASKILKLIKIQQMPANFTEPLHVGKKGQVMEEGTVINNLGDLVRVHVERNFAPVFFRVLKNLNIDVGRWFSYSTEAPKIPTTTPYVPTTTKQYLYIIFQSAEVSDNETATTTTNTTTSSSDDEVIMSSHVTTRKYKYKVVKIKDLNTTTAPSTVDPFYVDDEDDSEFIKEFGIFNKTL